MKSKQFKQFNKDEYVCRFFDINLTRITNFSFKFKHKLTSEEKKIIKKILKISDGYCVYNVVEKRTLVFRMKHTYRSYKDLYIDNDIDKNIIQTLKNKKIIIHMLNGWNRNTRKRDYSIYFYFDVEYFHNLTSTRKVLLEKHKSRGRKKKVLA